MKGILRIFLLGVVVSTVLTLLAAYAATPSAFTWTQPTTNSDGTVLSDLAGYQIQCGQANPDGSSPGVYTIIQDVPGANTLVYPVDGMITLEAKYYCVLHAYDTSGNMSLPTPEINFTFDLQLAPAAPPTFGLIP